MNFIFQQKYKHEQKTICTKNCLKLKHTKTKVCQKTLTSTNKVQFNHKRLFKKLKNIKVVIGALTCKHQTSKLGNLYLLKQVESCTSMFGKHW